MALTRERKAALAKIELPEDREVRVMLEEFLAISGFTEKDFGDACGYSRAAINLYRAGKYKGDEKGTLAIRAAIKEYIEGHRDQARRDLGKLYRKRNYQMLRKAFYGALDHGWAYCVYGPPGTQKSYVAEALIEDLRQQDAAKNGSARRVAYVYCRAGIKPMNLLQRIGIAAGMPSQGRVDQLIRKLQFHFSSRRVLLVLDEAQHLDDDCVEVVRELLDRPPYFGLLFMGSHDLQKIFQRLEMEQWRSRLQKAIELPGLDEEEATEIIAAELGTRPKAAVEKMIASSRVRDLRRGPDYTYISARSLFFAIEQVKRLEGASA